MYCVRERFILRSRSLPAGFDVSGVVIDVTGHAACSSLRIQCHCCLSNSGPKPNGNGKIFRTTLQSIAATDALANITDREPRRTADVCVVRCHVASLRLLFHACRILGSSNKYLSEDQ
jgi:hypothetical protein